jgi:cation diffusion facilitator CzcD-associated flavoprotein CzcO
MLICDKLRKTSRGMMACSVAVIGAGPYGLAVAAHLRAAGVAPRVFGSPMSFWKNQMPRGMLLRSAWDASHIGDPLNALSLNTYQAKLGESIGRPVPLDRFVDYGLWFQQQVAPDLDTRHVARLEATDPGFALHLEDGERVQADRVVIATGLAMFTQRPQQFDSLPASVASHSSDHADLAKFAGKSVMVVGSGQSALESAALLHEIGANVEIVARATRINWLRRRFDTPKLGPIRPLLYTRSDVGPPGINQLTGHPFIFKALPCNLKVRLAYRAIRPAGARWLRARVEPFQITLGLDVRSATPHQDRLRVTLSDGTERVVDHALLATGYKVDVRRYPFLDERLARSLKMASENPGYPILDGGFESSVSGLHIVGAPAAETFGPLMRFVSGTGYAGRAVSRRIAGATRAMTLSRTYAPAAVGDAS